MRDTLLLWVDLARILRVELSLIAFAVAGFFLVQKVKRWTYEDIPAWMKWGPKVPGWDDNPLANDPAKRWLAYATLAGMLAFGVKGIVEKLGG